MASSMVLTCKTPIFDPLFKMICGPATADPCNWKLCKAIGAYSTRYRTKAFVVVWYIVLLVIRTYLAMVLPNKTRLFRISNLLYVTMCRSFHYRVLRVFGRQVFYSCWLRRRDFNLYYFYYHTPQYNLEKGCLR